MVCATADQRNLDAQYTIAVIHDERLGVEQDFAIAFTWYKLAADQSFGPAIDALNELYSEWQLLQQGADR